MKNKTFLIIGLGLMGGSLAAALRKHFPRNRVLGVSRKSKTIKTAVEKRLIHQGFIDLKKALIHADIVFVCTPVDTIPEYVMAINRLAKPGTMVTDVGSTKSEIIRLINRKHLTNIRFIGSHPLAGSHETGVHSATAGLYQNAIVFVTPDKHSDRLALNEICSIWKSLGTRVSVMSPEKHDRLVSEISHLTHAIAALLSCTVSNEALNYCASGFLDTTRVAQGDPRLWVPIFQSNKKNLLRQLRRFKIRLENLIRSFHKNESAPIKKMLTQASFRRRHLNNR